MGNLRLHKKLTRCEGIPNIAPLCHAFARFSIGRLEVERHGAFCKRRGRFERFGDHRGAAINMGGILGNRSRIDSLSALDLLSHGGEDDLHLKARQKRRNFMNILYAAGESHRVRSVSDKNCVIGFRCLR